VLKSLGDKGLVTFNYSKPREYFGIAPVKAMDRLIGKKEKIIKKLKKQKDTTVKQLEKIDFDLGGYQKSEHPMWSVEPYKF
jgi:sugar-specific transcriptional regulator TrmB